MYLLIYQDCSVHIDDALCCVSERRNVCRHFVAPTGCRFGNSCAFLHPGVNGPPLDHWPRLSLSSSSPSSSLCHCCQTHSITAKTLFVIFIIIAVIVDVIVLPGSASSSCHALPVCSQQTLSHFLNHYQDCCCHAHHRCHRDSLSRVSLFLKLALPETRDVVTLPYSQTRLFSSSSLSSSFKGQPLHQARPYPCIH